MTATLIGIDCACDAKKVGLARSEWREGKAVVTDVLPGRAPKAMVETLASWIGQSETTCWHSTPHSGGSSVRLPMRLGLAVRLGL